MFKTGPAPPLSKRVFEKYDKDKSGAISAVEFHNLCYDMGYYLSPKEREIAVLEIDKSGNGQIEYDEFHTFWSTNHRFQKLQLGEQELARLETLIKYFRFWDKGNDGTLSKEDFRGCYNDLLKQNVTTRPFDECFASLDADGNGVISFNEFIEWFNTPKVRR